MANYRRGRINDETVKEISQILRDVKDPRVSSAFISVIAADVTPDLKFAKIYYSVLTGDAKEVAKGLVSSTGYIRRCLAQRLNLRITPELKFIRDTTSENGAHISELLHKIDAERAERSEDDE
ncbi:MAG: 30S ribosome-binding factor RbfA [Ruminococcaceae bacterium]|nr:30S ribosome-binding factor RbfA [Oscillospiraceae bacterium]